MRDAGTKSQSEYGILIVWKSRRVNSKEWTRRVP